MKVTRSVAIVGLGRAGLLHAKSAQSVGLKVVSHASLSQNSPRSIEFQREFPDSRQFAANDHSICETADLVVLATPPNVTHDIVSEYFGRSSQLLVEKPVALTTQRIHELGGLAFASGAKVLVGYNRRSYPAIAVIDEILRDDPPVSVEVRIVEDMQHVKASKSDSLQAAYLRHGSAAHFLDLVQYLFGYLAVESIEISCSKHDLGFFDYEFAGRCGHDVSIVGSIDAGDRSRRGLRFVTRTGREIHLSPLDRLTISQPGSDNSRKTAHPVEAREFPDSYVKSFKTQMLRIVTGEENGLHTLHDSLRLSQLIDAFEVVSR